MNAQPAQKTNELGVLPEWDLTHLYQSGEAPEFKADMARALDDAKAFEARYEGKLGGLAADALGQAIAEYEQLQELIGKIYSFSGLNYYTDTSDEQRAKLYGDVEERMTNVSSHLIFFELELNSLDEKAMETAFAQSSKLAFYKPWLEEVRKEKPYQLEAKIQKLFQEKSVTGFSAWNRLYDETLAALRFDVDGESLSIEKVLSLMSDNDGAKRKSAAEALGRVLKDNARLFTHITNVLAKDKDISDRWRGFDDIADSRHLANSVEREVVDALVSAVRAAYPRLSHRYYALKAKWFGKDKLDYWDRNAPLPQVPMPTIGWDEAREMVLSAYGDFAPDMRGIAARFFDENWIDAPAREGKASGAFAHPTVPSAHPYVLLNYLGKPRDVMTLAHELGHGVHQVLAGAQGALMASTPLTLAETASVFGEMLTFRRLLARTTNSAQRKALLAGKVEDMINTVVRQIAFYQFERKVHLARKDGELTTGQINDMWMSVQGESLGEAIVFHEGYESFWSYIPHFIHSPFYVYAYAFGDCLVNSLYRQFEAQPEGFVEKYFDMLKAGGSKHHSELLKPFGLNAADPAFWGMGIAMIEGFIDELEALG